MNLKIQLQMDDSNKVLQLCLFSLSNSVNYISTSNIPQSHRTCKGTATKLRLFFFLISPISQWVCSVVALHCQCFCICRNGGAWLWVSCQISKLWFAHAPGMSETFSPPPTSKETACQRSRHASRRVRDARVVMHAGIANPRWRGKRFRHSRNMCVPQFRVSSKRPMQRGRSRSNCFGMFKSSHCKKVVAVLSQCFRWAFACICMHRNAVVAILGVISKTVAVIYTYWFRIIIAVFSW